MPRHLKRMMTLNVPSLVMSQKSNLRLSFDKMDAVKETLSQTSLVVQSVVVSVRGED